MYERRRGTMDSFITRISRAAVMGLGWAFVWVVVGVVGAGLFLDELDPPHIGGPLYSGFVCGTLFSAVGGFASGRRRLEDMSLAGAARSEEHTSELQSLAYLVCRLLLE